MGSQDVAPAQELCEKLLARLGELGHPDSAVVVAGPVGKAKAIAAAGDLAEKPAKVVIWLLLDPTDIDSKQTTFVLQAAGSGHVYNDLYKLKLNPEVSAHAEERPSIAEGTEDACR